MYILARFFSTKEYARQFLDGSIYMSSLSTFMDGWDGPATLSHGQQDVLEGTVADVPEQYLKCPVMSDMNALQVADIKVRAKGYGYCNVCCFYRFGYRKKNLYVGNVHKFCLEWDEPLDMHEDFGKYVVIINDKVEFLKRIDDAIRYINWNKDRQIHYIAGPVKYNDLVLHHNGEAPQIAVRGMAASVIEENDYDIFELYDATSRHIKKCDAFDKWKLYEKQMEWRLLLNRGMKDTSAYRLEIGDIRDIAVMTRYDNLQNVMERGIDDGDIKLYPDAYYKGIGFDSGGYFGNIAPEHMREDVIALGDNKARCIRMVGMVEAY